MGGVFTKKLVLWQCRPSRLNWVKNPSFHASRFRNCLHVRSSAAPRTAGNAARRRYSGDAGILRSVSPRNRRREPRRPSRRRLLARALESELAAARGGIRVFQPPPADATDSSDRQARSEKHSSDLLLPPA